MSLVCTDLPALLAARPLGVLDSQEEAQVSVHLTGCSSCQELARRIQESLAATKPATLEPPADVWTRVEARIAADRLETERAERGLDRSSGASLQDKTLEGKTLEDKTSDGKPPALKMLEGRDAAAGSRNPRSAPLIALSCTFCHSEVRRSEALFCGSCLAPHHEGCFLQHGRCSAPGCTETRTVRPREPAARPRPRLIWPAMPERGSRTSLVALLVPIGIAAIALTALTVDLFAPREIAPPPAIPAPLPVISRAPDTSPVPPTQPTTERTRPTPTPSPIAPVTARWTQGDSWLGRDELSVRVRGARTALEEGRLSDAEDELLTAGALGFNVVREVWGNDWPELEPLRRRRGFFRHAALVTPRIVSGAPTRDPFVLPPQGGPK